MDLNERLEVFKQMGRREDSKEGTITEHDSNAQNSHNEQGATHDPKQEQKK